MKFALLGADEDSLELARAVAHDRRHALVLASVGTEAAADVRRLAPGAKLDEPWETLLGGDVVEAVIVGRDGTDEDRAEQLRRLVQAGIPLLVSHPIHPSMLVAFELEMIRQETHGIIVPYHRLRWSEAFDRLRKLATGQGAVLGSLEQLVFVRQLDDRSAEHVCEEFARDMDLARALVGELNKLSAMAPTSEPRGYATLGVQLSGEAGALVRWSVEPADRGEQLRLMVVGSLGTATLMARRR